MPALPDPARPVPVPGALALARIEAGLLAEAADAARSADAGARWLGFDRHFFAVDHLHALADLALERRDLDTAEHLTEQVRYLTERRRPLFEFLALLDRAQIWARSRAAPPGAGHRRVGSAGPDRGQHGAAGRADEQETLLRLSLGDPRSPAKLTSRLPASRRELLLARIALAAGDHHTAQQHLQAAVPACLTPRCALVRQILLSAAAIERADPMAASILGAALHTARRQGFLNTVVTTAPQVASYVVEMRQRQDRPVDGPGRLLPDARGRRLRGPERDGDRFRYGHL
jgi:LuxR family transcriptional regulator, maltose regulon positive regulatory protein